MMIRYYISSISVRSREVTKPARDLASEIHEIGKGRHKEGHHFRGGGAKRHSRPHLEKQGGGGLLPPGSTLLIFC